LTTFLQAKTGIAAEVGWSTGWYSNGGKEKGLRPREGGNKMEWEVVTALALAAPIILLPVAFVGYLTVGGIYGLVKEARKAGRKAEATA
jgi:hypothetical protein